MPRRKREEQQAETGAEDEPKKEGERKKRGARSQFADKVKPYLADIERYVRCGVTEGQICEFYKIGKTQWADYKKRFPEITETLYRAKAALRVDLVNRAYEVAVGYTYTEETEVFFKNKKGDVTGSKVTKKTKYAKADAGMLEFLLINRFPADFAKDPQMLKLREKALELAKQGKIPIGDLEGV